MMQFKKLTVLVSALTLTGLAAGDALAQRRDGKWVELGCQQVSFIGKDRDSIIGRPKRGPLQGHQAGCARQ
jgi:hypothetical protein